MDDVVSKLLKESENSLREALRADSEKDSRSPDQRAATAAPVFNIGSVGTMNTGPVKIQNQTINIGGKGSNR